MRVKKEKKKTLRTAAGVDNALWITVEITLPELIETPPAFSQRDNVAFCGDESNWQLQKSVCGFQKPTISTYISWLWSTK